MFSSSSSSSLQWMSLIGTIWLQTANGGNTDFPVYSSELKDLKKISQVGINFLAFASDAGKLFGWFSGVAAAYLPLWLVAAVGAAFVLVGYGLQFLLLDKPYFAYAHILLLTALAGNGICWINTACYLICIKNFASSADTRIAVGLSTSYVGLSAKIYTALASAVFDKKRKHTAKQYLLLNSLVPVLVAVVVSPFLRPIPSRRITRPSRGFIAMFAITSATGVCAVIGTIDGSASSRGKLLMIILGLLLASPLVIPLAVRFREAMAEVTRNKKENRVHDLMVADDVEAGGDGDVEVDKLDDVVEDSQSEDVGGLQMLKKVAFWLYFFSYLFSATLGMVFLNNLGQIAESRGLRVDETSTLVSLSSSFGFFGRLLPFLLDYYSSKKKCMISRAASMATLMAPMAGSFFLLLDGRRLSLYMSTAIVGAFTGAITSIAVSATRELFGTKHFSVNHNIVITNIPIGSIVFGYLAALVYQRGVQQGSAPKCIGNGCYQKTFVVWAITCSFGSLLCTLLYLRTRRKQ
ncbi:protein NUCLEAR FUSION DEFECTIVE 4-like [Canna indica]|uniref:Protein NUCLEAR FUSION DEFECTIVE 4-like n=1 Tax=Canna indica TaxID=4628 RepID=A0AAQ3Q3Q9_9LILI|nr:protein NUCLEAR FUSION DEFECTIVE 4-like [Canna indica]